MPKVLVQLNSLALGGTQINAVDFAAAVAAHGYESLLVGPADTLPRGPSLFDIAKERSVELETLDRPRSTVAGALAMARLAKEHDADLVHVYGSWTSRPAWWGPCLLGRRPLVLTVYEMAVDPMTPRHAELIVGTKYLAEELDWRVGTTLISPPVDTARDDPRAVSGDPFIGRLGLNPGNLRVVMVTRLDEDMKAAAVQAAIQAVGATADPGVDLVIVGTGDAEARLRALAENVNADQGRRAVVLAGPLADPRSAYAAADVLIGMGGSAARSLSFGKPLIVAGEAGWFRMFTPDNSAEHFRNSFWSPEPMPDPVGELRGILRLLLADARLRETLGRYGRDFAVRNFGLPAMARHLADTYDRALRNSGVQSWARDLPLEVEHLRRRFRRNPESTAHRGAGQFSPPAAASANPEREKTS
jgi:glycosyltransferase involved in cell wall biosynthesis